MPFVIFFSALLFLFGLVLLLRGLRTRAAQGGRRRRFSPWWIPILGTLFGVTLLLAGQKLFAVVSLPFIARLGHLFLRLPLASIFWVIVYQLLAMMRVSSASPSATSRKVRGFVMTPRQARRILGLSAHANEEQVKERATKLLRHAEWQREQEAATEQDSGKSNIVLLKILEAREVLLAEARKQRETDK